MDEYVATVRELWPHGEPARLVRRDAARGAGLLVLPHRRAPRLLVPATDRRAASAAMLRFSAALTLNDAVKRCGMAAALRLGLDAWLPDRVSALDDEGSLAQHLASEVFGEPVTLSLGLGTARANRKPVLQVFGSGGRTVGYVKLGINRRSQADVSAEAAALRRLEARQPLVGITVPHLLHDGTWRGIQVVVMTALSTSVLQRPTRRPRPPTDAMRVLHDAFHEGTSPLGGTPMWSHLLARAKEVTDEAARARLFRSLARLADLAGEDPLPVGAWHGDWTPWNMARRRDGIQLWDWERFETGMVHGLDVCHYGVNTVVRREGIRRGPVLAGLHAVGFTPHDRRRAVVAGAYLATITARYLVSAQGEHGERISAASGVMTDVLEEWLGSARGARSSR